MDLNWSASVSGLFGALIGGAISLGTTVGVEIWKTRRQTATLAIALKGEIDALLGLIDKRGYVASLDADIAAKQRGERVWRFVQITQDYFSVFATNTASIGMLDRDVTIPVIQFYTLAKSFVEDCVGAHDEYKHARTSGTVNNLDISEREFMAARQMLIDVIEAGRTASSRIEEKYGPKSARTQGGICRQRGR